MVSEKVRAAECDIDEAIRRLPIWNCQKDLLLRGLLDFWRDGLEVVYMRFAHSATFQSSESFEVASATEHELSAGIFWCLKWAFEYAPSSGAPEPMTEELVDTVMKVGAPYQHLVDALKFAKVGGYQIDVDPAKRLLTLYEGGNITGHDHSIVSLDRTSLLFHQQTPMVDDSDQLTKAWTAGEYRRYMKWLRTFAEGAETETVLASAGPLAPRQELFKRPVVLELGEPPAELQRIQDNLTLTQEKIDADMKWKISEWLDCPLVRIGYRIFAVSSVAKHLAGRDDFMLRVAVLNDRAQYEKTSGLREDRMIELCREVFEKAGWNFQSRFHLRNPPKEIDGFASKGHQDVVIQLKSTLRPHSPWEVYKRNIDVIEGIKHTADVLARFRRGALGFVITDGYEGDYSTWAESLKTRIPVATLQELAVITGDPIGAFQLLAKKAGIEGKPTFEPLPDRETGLCGWTLRFVDSAHKS